jgi:dienelactone hydrolase
MADPRLVQPSPEVFNQFILAQGQALRARNPLPETRREWEARRPVLRQAMLTAMGPVPDKPAPLEPNVVGVLKRSGYRIEKLVFQSRPGVWVTASAYVPEPGQGKLPAVLAVHGHWPWARRDPTVQARCLGLVKLGFFVLAVDAFGAGERYSEPAKGTYHGALYGASLWPTGQTLLGLQVYDNRRAVDYLLTRPEVDGGRIGVTGASGGGNQTMYAGALDERFKAVVPVCSVGNYLAYLRAACCVCEVLPGALRFTEEGDVLGLVAPRALMVVSASRDAFQFSVGEAEKSLARAREIYRLYGAADSIRHATFDSPHAYNQPMREAMYGWMTRWLKGEGKGEPIAEPKFEVEKVEELSDYPDKARPKGFLFLPNFAAQEARKELARWSENFPDHPEAWESLAVNIRAQLQTPVFGGFPRPAKPAALPGRAELVNGIRTVPLVLYPEPGMPMPVILRSKAQGVARPPACVLLHLDGKAEALKHPLAGALLDRGFLVVAPNLRATGETKPAHDAVGTAVGHNSAEHSVWIGRPLLGQWMVDLNHLLDYLAMQPTLNLRHVSIAGLSSAGLVALCAASVLEGRFHAAAVLNAPVTYVTEAAYGPKMRMGLLAPGILRAGDIPQIAATFAPRRLVIAEGISPQDRNLRLKDIEAAYAFTRRVYGLYKGNQNLTIGEDLRLENIAAALL